MPSFSVIRLRYVCGFIHKEFEPVSVFDMRGFAERGGTPNINLTDAERAKVHAARPGDIDTALQYLVSQPGVTRDVIGGGCRGIRRWPVRRSSASTLC
jgi:hypothetical protein